MLHEILLSLSGHPSPLLRPASAEADFAAGITPPERQLLASAAHLSDVHVKLITAAKHIAASHPSAICRAVAAAVESIHLAAFQRKVLEVEEGILKDDPAWVGAYHVVPLTAVMGEFEGWRRRLDWLWRIMSFVDAEEAAPCRGPSLMDRLRAELQSGYEDVKETAMSLVTAAEAAWLRLISAWILYGRLPPFGKQDFFVQKVPAAEGDHVEDFVCDPNLLPSFVTPDTAASVLFIGMALNHVRARSRVDTGLCEVGQLSSRLHELSGLQSPLDSAQLSRTVKSIRLALSESTLQRMLPLKKTVEMLQLLRDFFLLGRGEFAMALTHEADEKLRHRWRRAENLADEKDVSLSKVTVTDGEVAAVLSRVWAVLLSKQGQHADEDEQLEKARRLLRLQLSKLRANTPLGPGRGLTGASADMLASSPFHNLLFSVPSSLSIQLPSPLDMVLSPSDLRLYSCVNAYLLAMRRAHIRLTDLWKATPLRRQYPAIRGAGEAAVILRQRWSARLSVMRSAWTTASAAVFFLGETEAYLQTEVVAGLWDGFYAWLTGHARAEAHRRQNGHPKASGSGTLVGGCGWRDGERKEGPVGDTTEDEELEEEEGENDIWLRQIDPGQHHPTQQPSQTASAGKSSRPPHDPQALSTAHSLYLRTLICRLLLTQPTFTEPLYALLIHIDHLVSHMQRLQSIFTALDLETDAGVVDAFSDLDRDESEVKALLHGVESRVRRGIEAVVAALRALEADDDFMALWEGEDFLGEEDQDELGGVGDSLGYVPARVGGIDRLLMKLDFGSWFG